MTAIPLNALDINSATFEVGDEVTFLKDKTLLEGEVIGVDKKTVTVVYIAASGEYSIDKFPANEITKKGETSEIQKTPEEKEAIQREEEENREIERQEKNQHIQSIKNTLITLFLHTPENSAQSEIIQYKQSIQENLENILQTENIDIDLKNIKNLNNLSDDDIEKLAQNIDFIHELIFMSLIDCSIASSLQKPTHLYVKEIQNRLTHFDTQAKKLRDKKIQKLNNELFDKRTEEEKQYPRPEVMMKMSAITDAHAKKQNINPTKQKIFNTILEREKAERQKFIHHFLHLLREKRSDLLDLLQNESKKNENSSLSLAPQKSILILRKALSEEDTDEEIDEEEEDEEYNDANLQAVLQTFTDTSQKQSDVTTLDQLTQKMIHIMSNISGNTGIIQQYGTKEGFTSLLFLRITRILEAKKLAKQFAQKYNFTAEDEKKILNDAIKTSSTIFIKNFTELSEPLYQQHNTETYVNPHLTHKKSIDAIVEFFNTIALLASENMHENMETLKTKMRSSIPNILHKILPPELQKNTEVVYTDENGTAHNAIIYGISRNLEIDNPRYHIFLSYTEDGKNKTRVLNSQDNKNEIIALHTYRKNKQPIHTEKNNIASKNTQKYEENIKKIKEEIKEEIKTLISQNNSEELQNIDEKTKQLLDILVNEMSIESATKVIGEKFYTQIQNIPLEEQLQKSASLHSIMGSIFPKWTDSIIHGRQLFEYIIFPHINKKYDLNYTIADIKGGNMTEKYMYLYALAQKNIHEEERKEKLQTELSTLFYTAKHIGSATPHHELATENKDANIKKFITLITTDTTNDAIGKSSYEEKLLSAVAEEETRGNIFTTNKSQQITKLVDENQNPFPANDHDTITEI